MVFDSGKRPVHNQNNDWHRQAPKAKSKPKQIAQAIPIPRGFPLPVYVPKIPWMTGEDVQKIYNLLKLGRNPLTGEAIGSEAEKQAFKNLTPEQIKGLQNSKHREELKYADDSFRNDRSCAVMQLQIGNGGQPKSMMVKALTGADDPTLIVDPNGHTALFDGMYRGTAQKHQGLKKQVYEVEPIMPPSNKVEEAKARKFIQSKLAEWEQQSIIANQCGYGMRVAIPDEDLVRWTNQGLVNAPPGIKIIEAKLGGTYGEVRANTVGGEVHHMPANSINGLTEAKGPAIWMYTHHHKNTASNGKGDEAKQYRADQQKLINQGRFSDAIKMDIQNITKNFPGVYDLSIMQMLKKYKKSQKNGNKN
jgi:hypothetical protein